MPLSATHYLHSIAEVCLNLPLRRSPSFSFGSAGREATERIIVIVFCLTYQITGCVINGIFVGQTIHPITCDQRRIRKPNPGAITGVINKKLMYLTPHRCIFVIDRHTAIRCGFPANWLTAPDWTSFALLYCSRNHRICRNSGSLGE